MKLARSRATLRSLVASAVALSALLSPPAQARDRCQVPFRTPLYLRERSLHQAIPEDSNLIVAANRLPVTLEIRDGVMKQGNAGGGLVSAMKSTGEEFTWIGWSGNEISPTFQMRAAIQLDKMDPNLDLKPVFYSKAEKEAFYDEFSNRLLWPVFHGLTRLVPNAIKGWSEYKAINERFAQELLSSIREQAKRDDKEILAWVHDYQLLLVPGMLRSMLKGTDLESRVKIGFFLHIPFPKPEDFHLLPPEVRAGLLNGLIGADQIGFHSKTYARDFLATIDRERPGHRAGNGIRAADGHKSEIGAFPIGINPEPFRQIQKSPETQELIHSLQKTYQGYRVLLGVERLDPIKGLEEKLLGFQQFLRDNPEYRGKAVLLQVAQPSRMDVPEYLQLRDRLVKLADEINAEFAVPGRLPPVILNHKGFDTKELVAHFSIASTTVISSLKDGMNLVGLESVAVQKGRSVPANLILSKETGAAEWLKGALSIDPLNPKQIAQTMKAALEMPAEERKARVAVDLKHIETMTSQHWIADFLKAMID